MARKKPVIVGNRIEILELGSLKTNAWNPNEMPAHRYESLKHGLKQNGWFKGDAMLVWGKDEKGVQRNVIINGEHRWRAAQELGQSTGPGLVLNGITEAQARAWTLRLGTRGEFEKSSLDKLVKELRSEYDSMDRLALDFGLTEADVIRILAEKPITVDLPPETNEELQEGKVNQVVSKNSLSHMVPIYLDEDQHKRFDAQLKKLGTAYSLEVLSDTVREAVHRTYKELRNGN